MRIRAPILLAAAPAVAVALAACGGDGAVERDISAQVAKATVERSAHVRLAPESVPAEVREQGLRSAFTNAATAAQDRQAVGLFLLDDEDAARKVRELVRGSAPAASSRLMVNGNVVVLYAPAGKDRAAEVQQAVDALQ